MDCKQAEKIIPSFLRKDLEGRKLAQFVEHIEDCPECREELSIQFLVTEGMEKLEEGNSFNLQEELHERMEEARKHIRINQMLKNTLRWLELAVTAAIVSALCVYFRWI